jgi:cold-inducible RNA-binding protein
VTVANRRLYVGNLPYEMTEEALRQEFESVGPVASVKVVMDRDTGRSRGFGFVEMATDEGAEQALSGMNGRQVGDRGRTLRVAPAEQEQRRGGGGGGGGGRGDPRGGERRRHGY